MISRHIDHKLIRKKKMKLCLFHIYIYSVIYRCALTNNRSYRRYLFVELSLAVYYSPLVLLLCLYSFSLCNFFMSLLKKKKNKTKIMLKFFAE